MIDIKFLDYKTASKNSRVEFLSDIKTSLPKHYCLIETCNRVELFYESGDMGQRFNREVVKRLFRIVSGLESLAIGESEVQNQIKEAYLRACKKGTASRQLHLLFQNSLKVGKKVRRQTGICKMASSYSAVAYSFIKEFKNSVNLEDANIKMLFIGAHRMNKIIVERTVKNGAKLVFVANRTYKNAEELAHKVGAKAVRFDEFDKYLKESDIIVSATAAPHTIIDHRHKEIFKDSKKRLLIDLGFPRDVDKNIFRHIETIDIVDLEKVEERILINRNQATLTKLIKEAEGIVEDELDEFLLKYNRKNFTKENALCRA